MKKRAARSGAANIQGGYLNMTEENSSAGLQPDPGADLANSNASPPNLSVDELYDLQLAGFYKVIGDTLARLASLPLPARLMTRLSDLQSRIAITSETTSSPAVLVELSGQLGNLIAGVEDADGLTSIADDLSDIRAQYGEVNQQLSEVQIARMHQQSKHRLLSIASAQKAELTLQTFFAQAYRREWKSAAWLRALAFSLLLITVALAVWVAASINKMNWQSEVAHLAISLPLLGGAYFASYESRDHRRYARNERGWQARIDSFDNFCSPLPENLRNDVRTAFAKHLYADPPDFGSSASLADASQKALDQAVAIIRAVRSGDTAEA